MLRPGAGVGPTLAAILPPPTMIRVLAFLLLAAGLAAAVAPAADDPVARQIAGIKEDHPAKPEGAGLRLEVDASLEDSVVTAGREWKWDGARLTIEVALHNVSTAPISVPTTAYDEKPMIVNWGEGMKRILISIDAVHFMGHPVALVESRYSPVVLGPGEYVLLLRHSEMIRDRHEADALREASVAFGVQRTFAGPATWWRGSLTTYAEIKRRFDSDKEMARLKASYARYEAQREEEKDPEYGRKNAARVAALIAGTDRAGLRGEQEKPADEAVVSDPAWIRRFSEAMAATPLPRADTCFCAGWRTVYFSKDGQPVVSVAAIHGNQLRIHWPGGGGDYRVDEARWKAVKQVLDSVPVPGPTPEPRPGTDR